jgi:hypothetical protein
VDFFSLAEWIAKELSTGVCASCGGYGRSYAFEDKRKKSLAVPNPLLCVLHYSLQPFHNK